MRIVKKISCLVLAAITLMTCLTACNSSNDPIIVPGLKYATFQEFQENSTHRHPEKDDILRYALYTEYVQVIECLSDAEEIVIPDTYKGLPVISIRASAFAERENLKRVIIGQNILHIGESAFSGCQNLSQVKMSSSVNQIETNAFYACRSLTSIVIPPKVNHIPSGTFSDCSSLRKVIFESADRTERSEDERGDAEQAAREIEGGAFSGCTSLSIMFIPEDIVTVEDSIIDSDTIKPLVCGTSGSSAAEFAIIQCLDYDVVTRDNFDTHARLYRASAMANKTPIGSTFNSGLFQITLKNVARYQELGSVKASDNKVLVAATFEITHDTMIPQYFDGFAVTCTAHAPDKNNIMGDFRKDPIPIAEKVLGLKYPVGTITPGKKMTGVIVLEVSERADYVAIQFADTTFNV